MARLRAQGAAVIGLRNVSLDGRGGGGEGTVVTVTGGASASAGLFTPRALSRPDTASLPRASTITLTEFAVPELYLSDLEQLGQYRVLISQNRGAGPGGVGTLTVDFDSREATAAIEIELAFRICTYPFKECSSSDITPPAKYTLRLSSESPGGRGLDVFGHTRLAGELEVAATGRPVLDAHFGLPAQSSFEFEAQVAFPSGPPPASGLGAACRGGKTAFEEPSPLYFESGVSALAIGTGLPPFRFDPAHGNGGRQPGGDGIMAAIGTAGDEAGKATFQLDKDRVNIAPLEVIPAIFNISLEIPWILVNITLQSDLTGELDVCTGQLEMLFNATFTPVVGELSQTPLTVATLLTTETSTGYKNTRHGRRFDDNGDCELVGVAKVPVTDDPLENWLLQLPNDAITEMPSIFSVGCAGVAELREALKCDERPDIVAARAAAAAEE